MTSNHRGTPTIYKGINFRSRLEARWAVLFDNLGWKWEYEPECQGAYIPDFLLHGSDGRRIYVEVKPRSIYLQDRADIIAKARAAVGTATDLLVLCEGFEQGEFGEARLGYMPPNAGDCRNYDEAYDMFGRDEIARLVRPIGSSRALPSFDFNHSWGAWECRLSGHYEGNAGFAEISFADAVHLWNLAGNTIQWKPIEKAKSRREMVGNHSTITARRILRDYRP